MQITATLAATALATAALTGGGPRNATSVLVTYAYDTGFVTRDQGYAAAIGMVLLLVTLAFTALRWRTSHSRDLVG